MLKPLSEKCLRILFVAFCGIFVAATNLATLWAQSDIPPEKQANLYVTLNFERLRSHPLGRTIDVGELLKASGFSDFPFWELDLEKVDLIEVLIRLPEDIETWNFRGTDIMPFEIAFKIKAQDESAFAVFFQVVENDSTVEIIDGVTMYRPLGGPENVAAVFQGNQFMVGTDEYLMRESKEVLSPNLIRLLQPISDSSFRVVADLTDSQTMLAALVQDEMTEYHPPFIQFIIRIGSWTQKFQGSIDFENENFLWVSAQTANEADLGKLQNELHRFLEMAKQADNADIAIGKPIRELAGMIRAEHGEDRVILKLTQSEILKDTNMDDWIKNQEVEKKRRGELNSLRQVAIGFHNYESTFARFPQSDEISTRFSWRVVIAPFLEANEIFDRIDLKQSWDSEANKFLATETPEIYGENGMTRIVGIKTDKPVRTFRDVLDGTSNTILYIMSPDPVPWAQPNDLTINEVVALFDKLAPHDSILVALYDGSVRSLSASIDRVILRALLTPDGGEVIHWDRVK